ARTHVAVRPGTRSARTLRGVSRQRGATAVSAPNSPAAREWAKRLGRVGIWSIDVERLAASDARAYVREVERLGFRTLWIQEGLGSKEIFAHAALLLSATERLVIATGIANMWARDAVALSNGGRRSRRAHRARDRAPPHEALPLARELRQQPAPSRLVRRGPCE